MAEIDKEKIGQIFNEIQNSRTPIETDMSQIGVLFNEIQTAKQNITQSTPSTKQPSLDDLLVGDTLTISQQANTNSFDTVEPNTKELTKQYIMSSDNQEEGDTKQAKKKKEKKLHWMAKFMIFVDVCAVLCFMLVYGPIDTFRNWFVTTAASTASHRYFAYTFFSKEYVSEIISQYKRVQTESNTDIDAIKFVVHDENEQYSSIYEEQILKKENKDDLYKIVEIQEDKYSGFIAVLYDPTRLALAEAPGKNGIIASKYCKENDCLLTTNAGPANWLDGCLYPYNTVIADSKLVYAKDGTSEIIGMNQEGVLCLLTTTAQEAVDKYNLKWGVEFGPFLIVNGVKTQFVGTGGYGTHPRTAIGQRQDGIVLIFIIDGRGGGGSAGITMPDLCDLMARYGCYNAANLDGGGSTVLVEKGVVINNPTSYQYSRERKELNVLYYK